MFDMLVNMKKSFRFHYKWNKSELREKKDRLKDIRSKRTWLAIVLALENR